MSLTSVPGNISEALQVLDGCPMTQCLYSTVHSSQAVSCTSEQGPDSGTRSAFRDPDSDISLDSGQAETTFCPPQTELSS